MEKQPKMNNTKGKSKNLVKYFFCSKSLADKSYRGLLASITWHTTTGKIRNNLPLFSNFKLCWNWLRSSPSAVLFCRSNVFVQWTNNDCVQVMMILSYYRSSNQYACTFESTTCNSLESQMRNCRQSLASRWHTTAFRLNFMSDDLFGGRTIFA